jgi:hypothetical protein
VAGLPTTLIDPEPIVPVAGGDDTSPLVYILPGIALSLMLVAGFAYAVRTSDRDRRARISA